ncbi:hypothetical protein PUMCH_003149 [Australozyma saopauloensis]|uniref:Splicing factor U2AF 23 kDa subunit n=1 Tax=Australozyma saopauloensis TaxID=291208 RepID=A0AAX4HBA9_9ASCO|nr:hypothetical protein PUMCH_003149 [[Candida] saopauloensis]
MSDRSLCQFYQKIGACRHGDKCSRRHVKPTESKTVLLANLYQDPKKVDPKGQPMSAEDFDQFYADVYVKVAEKGEVESMVVCENENFHLSGNVYVRFTTLEAANNAVMTLNQEWFGGRPVYCDLLPVSSFQEANCRAHDTNSCPRGGLCNFMHVRRPGNEMRRQLRQAQEKSLALAELRRLKGADWGREWEEPTKRKYTRESEVKKEPKIETPEVVAEDKPEPVVESKATAVAKLFGA